MLMFKDTIMRISKYFLINILILFFSVYLTDMKTTHHQLPYNVYDQCKLQPGKFEHNAYGFVFKLPENLMCDE